MNDAARHGVELGFAELGRLKLHYAKAGSGSQLVVLLHGFPEFWYSWRYQLKDLSGKHTVVAPDMRGYNLSDKPSEIKSYRIEELVDDVVALIRHFGHEKAAVVGHDWGAAVGWAISQRNPEVLTKLACLQVPPPSVWRKNQTLRQFIASWYMFFFQIPLVPELLLGRADFQGIANSLRTTTARDGVFSEEDIERYKEAWRQPGAITGGLNYYRANILKRILGKGPSPRKIEVPTLFIYGQKDSAILPQTVEGVRDMVTGEYTEIRIPESAHWVQSEAREEVSEALIKFLAD